MSGAVCLFRLLGGRRDWGSVFFFVFKFLFFWGGGKGDWCLRGEGEEMLRLFFFGREGKGKTTMLLLHNDFTCVARKCKAMLEEGGL